MKSTLAWARTFPPSESEGWTIHFIERESRYWIAAQAGQKQADLFQQGTALAWAWAAPAQYIRWFTDGERRYGTALWRLASVFLQPGEADSAYGRHKVWREGWEWSRKIKGSHCDRPVTMPELLPQRSFDSFIRSETSALDFLQISYK